MTSMRCPPGCIKELQVVASSMNPLQGSFYGVEASCGADVERVVALAGAGFVQLRAPSAKKDFSVAFGFKTRSNDALLLYTHPVVQVQKRKKNRIFAKKITRNFVFQENLIEVAGNRVHVRRDLQKMLNQFFSRRKDFKKKTTKIHFR